MGVLILGLELELALAEVASAEVALAEETTMGSLTSMEESLRTSATAFMPTH